MAVDGYCRIRPRVGDEIHLSICELAGVGVVRAAVLDTRSVGSRATGDT